jgi:hypothetical protein
MAFAGGVGTLVVMRPHFLPLAIAVLALGACRVADTPRSDGELLARIEPPLEIGRTTRQAALLRFGLPAERFEGDRILCWRLAVRSGEPQPISLYVTPWYATPEARPLTMTKVDPRFHIESGDLVSLVLVFDEAGVLRKARALRQP